MTIPDSVTEIGGGAFSYTDLTSVTIPDSVVSLGGNSGNVFSNCKSLESVTLGSGITEIMGYTFYACENLKSITIPDNVTVIDDKAFIGSGLKSITIGSGVESIGEQAFYRCDSLTHVEMGSSVTSIGVRAFGDCKSLKSITISGGATNIGNYAFVNCTGLTDINLTGVASIGSWSFQNCTSLTSVTIPSSVTSIGDYAFTDSTSLESVTLHNRDTKIGAYVFQNPSLKTVYGIKDSTAQKFAERQGYTFVAIAPMMDDAPNLGAASSWAQEQINEANYLGLIPESLQSAYTQNITRAEFCALAVVLYEKASGKELTKRQTFSDTSDANVEKMAALKVVSGVSDDQFSPDSPLTREQAATMLNRLATVLGTSLPNEEAAFSDMDSVSSWAVHSVGRMQASGVMGGVGGNNFDPQGAYTREQSIATVLRLYEIVKWK